jgi:uncharacterized membrane protein YbhN (UPF0104 family)
VPDWNRHAETAAGVPKTEDIGRLARTPLARIALLLVAGGIAWPLVAHAREAIELLGAADLRPLVAAGLLHVAMLVASALCWRQAFRACGGTVGCADACVRYGVGTFLNAVTPARAGGAVRIGLFARSLQGERTVQRSAVAIMGIGSVRGVAVTLLVAGAAVGGLAPRWLAAAPLVVAGAAIAARWRIESIRAHLGPREAGVLFGWPPSPLRAGAARSERRCSPPASTRRSQRW